MAGCLQVGVRAQAAAMPVMVRVGTVVVRPGTVILRAKAAF